jgi:tRNA pseudouridine38-40 synthase
MRLAFRVCYLGDDYFGSQMQPDKRTVEGVLVSACRELRLFDDWRDAGFSLAGRTDRGVHARGQICAFSTEHPERALTALNLILPRDCWCTGWSEVADDFQPRYAAQHRTYRYYFYDMALNAGAMDQAAEMFIGTHDFSGFARVEGKNPVRTILQANAFEDNGFTIFEVTGESFLWNMVRCMATALEKIGNGAMEPGDLALLLEGHGKGRVAAAPAEGLVLWEVECGLAFHHLGKSGSTAAFIENVRRRHAILKKIVEILD